MMTSRLTLTVLAMATVLAAPQAFAQSTATQPVSNQSAKQDKHVVTPQQQQTAAPKSAPTRAEKKPAAKPAEAAPQQPAANPQAKSAANPQAKKDVPRIETNPLGRVRVDNQGSTFGFSSETKMKAYETPDGQRIRGMDHAITSNRQNSYFGLSLSVPTTSTSSGDAPRGLLPLPLPPRP
jgi:hypothetical protein